VTYRELEKTDCENERWKERGGSEQERETYEKSSLSTVSDMEITHLFEGVRASDIRVEYEERCVVLSENFTGESERTSCVPIRIQLSTFPAEIVNLNAPVPRGSVSTEKVIVIYFEKIAKSVPRDSSILFRKDGQERWSSTKENWSNSHCTSPRIVEGQRS